MKKFGTMIIKPDATNFDELKLVQRILKKYDLYEDNLCFAFKNYPEIILEYRKKDILFKNISNLTIELPEGMVKQTPEEELKYCRIAVAAYEKFFSDRTAFVLLIPTRGRDNNDFFNLMYNAKREIRSELKKCRENCYAYINYETPNQEMMKLSNVEYEKLSSQNPQMVNLAHVDGVHVEDKECFLNNFCLSFMVSVGIINKTSQTSLQQQIDGLSRHEHSL